MVDDGKFLWADIPNNFPDISVLGYTEAQLDDLKHISLVDAIKEARRRLRAKKKNQARRADMEELSQDMPRIIAAMNEAEEPPPPSSDISVTVTGASSQPAATGSPTTTPSTDHSPSADTPCDKHKDIRRRLENDEAISTDLSKRFGQAPLFLGKTPVKNIADILPAANLSTHMSKILIDQIKEPKDSIPEVDRLDDPTNLDLLARFIYQVHEYLTGGLNYSSYQEKWIVKQLVPNSTAAEAFKLKWDTISTRYEVNCTSCRFADLSQFREALLSALYGNSNIFQLVTNYVEKLSVSHRNPTAPKTCMDLVLRAERVYNLLGTPHYIDTANQIAVIIKQLPPATASAIQIAALTNPALIRTYGELKKFISLMDEQFKTEMTSRQKKFSANKNNRNSDGKQHQQNTNNNNNKSVGAKQHHNNSIQHSKNNSNRNTGKIPDTPFTGNCDHCGIKGHRIRDCRKATDAQKAEWLKKFNERKNAKRKQPEDNKS